jgi:hypothetical protein
MEKSQLILLIIIIVLIPLGILSKSYQGWGSSWVNNFSGDVLYEMFWCLLIFLVFPYRDEIGKICWSVFFITCALEFLQLRQDPILVSIRSLAIGRLLLGTTFSWWDFPHYFLGCWLSWLFLKSFKSHSFY